jgi:hypothetical protein
MQPKAKSPTSNEMLSLSVMMIILVITQALIYIVTSPYV